MSSAAVIDDQPWMKNLQRRYLNKLTLRLWLEWMTLASWGLGIVILFWKVLLTQTVPWGFVILLLVPLLLGMAYFTALKRFPQSTDLIAWLDRQWNLQGLLLALNETVTETEANSNWKQQLKQQLTGKQLPSPYFGLWKKGFQFCLPLTFLITTLFLPQRELLSVEIENPAMATEIAEQMQQQLGKLVDLKAITLEEQHHLQSEIDQFRAIHGEHALTADGWQTADSLQEEMARHRREAYQEYARAVQQIEEFEQKLAEQEALKTQSELPLDPQSSLNAEQDTKQDLNSEDTSSQEMADSRTEDSNNLNPQTAPSETPSSEQSPTSSPGNKEDNGNENIGSTKQANPQPDLKAPTDPTLKQQEQPKLEPPSNEQPTPAESTAELAESAPANTPDSSDDDEAQPADPAPEKDQAPEQTPQQQGMTGEELLQKAEQLQQLMKQLESTLGSELMQQMLKQALEQELSEQLENFAPEMTEMPELPELSPENLETLKQMFEDNKELLNNLTDEMDLKDLSRQQFPENSEQHLEQSVSPTETPPDQQQSLDPQHDSPSEETSSTETSTSNSGTPSASGDSNQQQTVEENKPQHRPLDFGEESSTQQQKFKAVFLPPGWKQQAHPETVGVSASAPKVQISSQPEIRSEGTTSKSSIVYNRKLRPRHQSVVDLYFQNQKSTEPAK